MKKVLLSGLALFAGLAASFGQSCSEGFFPELHYAGDKFTKKTSWNNVYWWTQYKEVTNVQVDSLDEGDALTCHIDSLPFNYSWTRVLPTGTTPGKIAFTLTQRYGKYEPVGVGWGTDKSGKQAVLDLSGGNEKITFTFTNTSAYNVQLRVALQDSLKKSVNAYGDAADDEVYLDEATVSFDVNAGKSITKTVNFTPAGTDLAYQSVYVYDACSVGTAFGKEKSFNPKIVSAVTFTVINQLNSKAFDGYKPYTLNNATFEISDFHVGAPVVICTGLDDNNISGKSFKVVPNPATSYVEFPEAQSVKVMDAMGKMVYSANTASRIDVSNLTKGVYVIQTSNGVSRFVVE